MRIAKVAKDKPNETFTSLIHLINEQAIKDSHNRMIGKRLEGWTMARKKGTGKTWTRTSKI